MPQGTIEILSVVAEDVLGEAGKSEEDTQYRDEVIARAEKILGHTPTVVDYKNICLQLSEQWKPEEVSRTVLLRNTRVRKELNLGNIRPEAFNTMIDDLAISIQRYYPPDSSQG